MKNIKVYKMNDCDMVASKLSKEETNKWYQEYIGYDESDQPLDYVEEVNINEEMMYTEISIEEAHELLYELAKGNKVNGRYKIEFAVRDYFGIAITLAEELKNYKDIELPFIICSTEY